VTQTLIYITTASKEEAINIACELVNIRLAACANIMTGSTSIFHWEGKVCKKEEVTLILKTREDYVERLIKKVKNMHSYDCPCIISLPISGGNTDFLNWINEETALK